MAETTSHLDERVQKLGLVVPEIYGTRMGRPYSEGGRWKVPAVIDELRDLSGLLIPNEERNWVWYMDWYQKYWQTDMWKNSGFVPEINLGWVESVRGKVEVGMLMEVVKGVKIGDFAIFAPNKQHQVAEFLNTCKMSALEHGVIPDLLGGSKDPSTMLNQVLFGSDDGRLLFYGLWPLYGEDRFKGIRNWRRRSRYTDSLLTAGEQVGGEAVGAATELVGVIDNWK